MEENFFLISSASSDQSIENTRASFTNILPKTFSTNSRQICLAIENAVFDNTFSIYESLPFTPDLILTCKKQSYKPVLGKCNTLQELCTQISDSFIHFALKSKQSEEVSSIEYEKNIVTLKLRSGRVKISEKLFHFLNLGDFTRIVKVAGKIYFVLREEYEDGEIVCQSTSPVKINERLLDYLDITCDSIESYPADGGVYSKILASIPLNNLVTTYYETPIPRFHKIDSSYLRCLKIEFRQPNGEKVFFNDGPPNLLKFKLKMIDITKDFFYITVSSEVTENFPENSISRFEVELPREYSLKGEWVVSVTNAFIPPPRNFLKLNFEEYEIEEKDAYCCVRSMEDDSMKKCSKLDLLRFTRRELCIFFAVNFDEFFDIYLNEEENIFLTLKRTNGTPRSVQIFTSRKLMSILNSHNFIQEELPANKSLQWYNSFQEVSLFIRRERLNYEDMVGGLIEKIYPDLPRDFLYFNMKAFYNISDLSQVLLTQMDPLRKFNAMKMDFIQREELRLAEWYQCNRHQDTRELLPSFFFIYCDFVKEIPIGDKYANVLKTIPYKNGARNLPGGFYSFNTNEFYTVNRQCLRSMDFMLKTQSGEVYNYFHHNESVRLTMKFQKIS